MNGGTYQTMLDTLINVRERYELYDMQLDKHEINNLANDEKFKTIKDQLTEKVKVWMKFTKDPLLLNQIQ